MNKNSSSNSKVVSGPFLVLAALTAIGCFLLSFNLSAASVPAGGGTGITDAGVRKTAAGGATATFSPTVSLTRTSEPTFTPTSNPTASVSPSPCPPAWSIITSPNPSGSENILKAVSAVSPTDIWAVGYYFYSTPDVNYYTLIEHWDGTSWSVIPSPNPEPGSFLTDVSALAANDVWAVGDYYSSQSGWQTLIEHWDGTSWSIVESPNAPSGGNFLHAVAAVAANDAWAVGYYSDSPDTLPLILHWDGTSWSISTVPDTGATQHNLNGIDVVSASDIWAVGTDYFPGEWRTLTLHWDGTSWSIIPSPNPAPYENAFLSVSAVSTDNVWAVGYSIDGGPYETLIEHWDGSVWSVVPSPNFGTGNNYLGGVSAQAANDVWAVGYHTYGTSKQTLIEHWDGSVWSVVSGLNGSSYDNELSGVATLSRNDVWVVGTYVDASPSKTLMEQYTPRCVTPTPTPTPCVFDFEDVREADWFYEYVQWMYCHGVITGYAGPPQCSTPGATCFKPGNNNTRGQMTKIVVLAFDLPIDTKGGPHFTDVPSGSTFYEYVETMRNLEMIDGYDDGTFRPNADVTRAQLAKIAVNAAIYADAGHWALVNPVDSTFEDVGIGSTFFRHIETAALHQILRGYPCGTPPAGPCNAGNKPYFLPGNNATRAQLSKIVYLALPKMGP